MLTKQPYTNSTETFYLERGRPIGPMLVTYSPVHRRRSNLSPTSKESFSNELSCTHVPYCLFNQYYKYNDRNGIVNAVC